MSNWVVYRTTIESIELNEEEDGEINSEREAIEVAKEINDQDWTQMNVSYEADED